MPEKTYPIYWLLIERTPASLSEAGAFLSPGEQQKLSRMRFPKRRDEWLLGRWTAKTLICSLPGHQAFSPTEIEIVNTPEGAPQVCFPDGRISPFCLSISHSGLLAFCALTRVPGLKIGVDLEKIEPRSKGFVEDYFTTAEKQLVDSFPLGEQQAVVTLIWSLKEAMLKALGVGLHRDTRQVEVLAIWDEIPGVWQAAAIGEPGIRNRPWSAWWQRRGDFVMTIAGFTEHAGPSSVSLVEQHA
ncbi:MAG: 4'-phosphopantetheinyl transferase superfamily protein [Chloroflexota bacterium]